MVAQTKPPFAYYGGKTTLAKRIAATLPDHRHYVEPFAGSLAVLLAKARSPFETVNDLDEHLVTFWRVLRDQPEELARACALTPHSRSEYGMCRRGFSDPEASDLERARRVWVSLTQGRGGTLRVTGWRHFQDPGSRGPASMPDYLASYVDRMRAAAGRLADVSLECRPALDVITDYGKHSEVLIYADPPYLGTTRSSRQYLVEMSHEAEHRELADALHGCKAAVVLSGYASPLYEDLYGDWDRVEMATYTGQGNHTAERNDRRVEVLWMNRTLPGTLDFGGVID